MNQFEKNYNFQIFLHQIFAKITFLPSFQQETQNFKQTEENNKFYEEI